MPVFVPAFFSLKGRATVEGRLPCVWPYPVKSWRRRIAVGTASPRCSSAASPARSIWTSCRRPGSATTCWSTSASPSAKWMRPRPGGPTSCWSRWARWKKSEAPKTVQDLRFYSFLAENKRDTVVQPYIMYGFERMASADFGSQREPAARRADLRQRARGGFGRERRHGIGHDGHGLAVFQQAAGGR